VIKKPMDLNQVRVRLNGHAYDSLKALVADLNLVFDNACKFNDPDSQLYKDALTLQKELLNLKSQFVGAEQLLLGGVQSVQSEVRRILTNILSALMSHKVEGRCLR
jgi:protein polybromo-1